MRITDSAVTIHNELAQIGEDEYLTAWCYLSSREIVITRHKQGRYGVWAKPGEIAQRLLDFEAYRKNDSVEAIESDLRGCMLRHVMADKLEKAYHKKANEQKDESLGEYFNTANRLLAYNWMLHLKAEVEHSQYLLAERRRENGEHPDFIK